VLTGGMFAQGAERWYFQVDPALGGDVLIESISCKSDGDEISKIFEIECFEGGDYYVDGWVLIPLTGKGFQELKVSVNGVLSDFSFKSQTNDWQSLALTNEKGIVATIGLKRVKI